MTTSWHIYAMSNTLPESLAYNLVNDDADHVKTHLLRLRCSLFESFKAPTCKENYEMFADKRLLLKLLNFTQFIMLFSHPRNVILSLMFLFSYIENRNPFLLGKLNQVLNC